ncbi:MAG: NAD(P)/FAD-dependent oxidoreductase [Eubacterium sp.]|nr:NAD(P)/FAD-dependent oxidoreductase [Eubacterium sp.]
MYDVIIIGAGPAGISASLYAKRANKSVLVIYHGESQLEKAHAIDNYYGFPEGITGTELYENGIAQAKALGVEVKNEEALHIEMNAEMCFDVTTTDGKYTGEALILSTGNKKIRPNIKGVEAFEGKGVSYCAICDGFFYRKKSVAVIGGGDYALSEAGDLENIVSELTVLTNGKPAPDNERYKFIETPIKEIKGEERVSAVVFEDGSELEVSGVFIAEGVAGGADFAKKIGIATDGDSIKTDARMLTNVPGVFACGNVTGGLLQVCKAVYEGAEAGLSAVNYLKTKKEK